MSCVGKDSQRDGGKAATAAAAEVTVVGGAVVVVECVEDLRLVCWRIAAAPYEPTPR